MEKQVCVFLADGFEEIEGLTVVDLLRRAGIVVTTVSVTGEKIVHGAHGIDVCADALFEEQDCTKQDMLVLPGGMPGTLNLGAHPGLHALLHRFYEEGKYLAAICAAPSILGENGFLNGHVATSYPGFEKALKGAKYTEEAVAISGNLITSRGLGTAIVFSLALIEVLAGKEKADAIAKAIIYHP